MQDAEIDLRRVFGLVQRQTKLISAVAAAVICLGVLILFTVTPIYTTSSLIILGPQQRDLLDSELQTAANLDNARVESEAELLRSDSILLKVIADKKLIDDPAFAPSAGLRTRIGAALGFGGGGQVDAQDRQSQVLAKLRGAVSVQRRGPTYLIAVQVQLSNPVLAAELANAIAQAFIEDQIASKVDALLSARDVLQSRLADARQQIILSEANFNAFLQRTTNDLASQASGSQLKRLNEELSALEASKQKTVQLIHAIDSSLAADELVTLVRTLPAEQAGVLGKQRSYLAQQIALEGMASPARSEFQAQIAALDQQVRQAGMGRLETLRSDLAAMDDRQSSLRDQLRAQIMQSDLPADLLTGLYDLQGKATFAREQYQSLLARTLELESQSTLQLADSRIASPALPPSTPNFPSTAVFLLGSAGIGLLLGLASSVVFEAVVGGFMSPEQLGASLKIPVAASIPRLALEPGNDTLADLVITAPLSRFSEAMRRMRLAIDYKAAPKAGRVIMIASALPGEGKTMTALGLARSYALSGCRTLLIDCDLRQPSIAGAIGAQPRATLLQILEQQEPSIDLGRAVSHELDSGLSMLLGVRGTDGPPDKLLGTARFDNLIREAKAQFDIVVLDTPPIEPVVDALYLAPKADLIVMVTRWASTPHRDAKHALTALLQARNTAAPIIGILNGWAQKQVGRNKTYLRFYDADFAWSPTNIVPDNTIAQPRYQPQPSATNTGQALLLDGQKGTARNSLRDALDELDA